MNYKRYSFASSTARLMIEDPIQRVKEFVSLGKLASHKTNDFFILYQSKDVNGAPLADEEFALKLKVELEREKLTSGKKTKVGIANEDVENTEILFADMSESVVILVVLSESALQTFSGDIPVQSNFLLHIQFALKLSDACSARILGLNLSEVEEHDNTLYVSKFQGWAVKFSENNHPSNWIQDSIDKSMRQLFSIQGINIDKDDWEFKVPALFASFYAAVDDLNASQWRSIHRIIPWKSISGLLLTFAYSFCLPVLGFVIGMLYWKFSKKSERHRVAHFNTSLFATGLVLMFVSVALAGIAINNAAQGALCNSQVKCQIMVRAGSRWSLWNGWSMSECESLCYPNDPGHNWSQEFSAACAECVCRLVMKPNSNVLGADQKNCNEPDWSLAGTTGSIFIVAVISLGIAINRLQQHAYKAFGRSALKKSASVKNI